jgi:hypothetical protein
MEGGCDSQPLVGPNLHNFASFFGEWPMMNETTGFVHNEQVQERHGILYYFPCGTLTRGVRCELESCPTEILLSAEETDRMSQEMRKDRLRRHQQESGINRWSDICRLTAAAVLPALLWSHGILRYSTVRVSLLSQVAT